MRPIRALVVTSLLLGPPAGLHQPAPAAGSGAAGTPAATGVIIGTVVAAGLGAPLGYAVVSIDAIGRERFTDGSGRFILLDVPAGRMTLRAKHIGYTPADSLVDVRAGDTVRVRIELAKAAVQLPAVTSVGNCAKPGAPRREVDPGLFVLFDQLKQNAERSRLLTRSYPFEYTVLRIKARQSSRDPTAPPDTVSVDTLEGNSQRDWRYKPGNMVVMQHDGSGIGEVLILPELGDFADKAFIDNHCFGYGGIEHLEGLPLVRIDFAPADKIKEPDIAGSVYLDSATFQIRRAELALTKPSSWLRQTLTSVAVQTHYTELAPGIPMLSSYASVAGLSDEQQRQGWARSMTTQSILDVQWLKGKP